MEFTLPQKLTMATGVVGAATSAFGALNPVMTSTEALIGTVIFGFVSACLGVIGTVVSSQSAQVKAVAAMPGVESINVNSQANTALATLAVDPTQAKVAPTPSAEAAVQKTAAAS